MFRPVKPKAKIEAPKVEASVDTIAGGRELNEQEKALVLSIIKEQYYSTGGGHSDQTPTPVPVDRPMPDDVDIGTVRGHLVQAICERLWEIYVEIEAGRADNVRGEIRPLISKALRVLEDAGVALFCVDPDKDIRKSYQVV